MNSNNKKDRLLAKKDRLLKSNIKSHISDIIDNYHNLDNVQLYDALTILELQIKEL